VIILFFVLGEFIDGYLHHHPVTIHYKVLGGMAGAGLILFLARQMKGIVLRAPVRKEEVC
jgi:hypothetical protein